MKTLFLMRHAKSSWKNADLSDAYRPLKKNGKKSAAKAGQHLKKKNLVPELILCSTAERARETADHMVREMDYQGETHFLDELYMAEPETIFKMIATHGGEAVSLMIIGHNPGLECTAQRLAQDVISLPTASLAHFELDSESWDKIKDAEVVLIDLWHAKPED